MIAMLEHVKNVAINTTKFCAVVMENVIHVEHTLHEVCIICEIDSYVIFNCSQCNMGKHIKLN